MRGGYVTVAADSVILTSGKPVRLYGSSITSGGTPGVVVYRDGTSASGTSVFSAVGTANLNSLVANIPAHGVYFPNGLFVDMDANVTAVTVCVEQISIS